MSKVRVRRLLPLVASLPLLLGQAGPRLVPDISARNIEIRYSFSGAQLLLFGAILYPGGRTPTRQLDVAVVLKGPVQPLLVREKQKIAGIWMNADSHRFSSAPSYYAVASNRPLRQILDERTAAVYELGVGDLQLSPGGGAQPDKERRFETGLLELRTRQGLYAEDAHGVTISDGVLYRARISIPSQVPVGTYETETFLIDRGKVIAASTKEVEVRKAGFERFVATAARRHGFLYGLTAVLLSLLLGWSAAAVLGRRG
ncbi:TIGR02186 family protein [Sphingomonas rosea]|uniref:TIGR02186 family protein n=1 Tax=Sphingomonas rosea TaxID=335605 RepID=A0ABP7TVG9_9SPHN